MAVTGWKSPGTMANVDRGGMVAWSNPTYVATSNDTYATCAPGVPLYGDWLQCTNFGFASPADIPAGNSILGIEIAIERSKTGSGEILDSAIYLRKTSGQVGVNKQYAAYWPTSDAIWYYGASGDLWGESWTIADIISADFGIDISVLGNFTSPTARIDHVQIRIYYGVSGAQMML